MKKIQSTYNDDSYEVHSLHQDRKFCDVYSCENKCHKCRKNCELITSLYEVTGYEVGA